MNLANLKITDLKNVELLTLTLCQDLDFRSPPEVGAHLCKITQSVHTPRRLNAKNNRYLKKIKFVKIHVIAGFQSWSN